MIIISQILSIIIILTISNHEIQSHIFLINNIKYEYIILDIINQFIFNKIIDNNINNKSLFFIKYELINDIKNDIFIFNIIY